MFGIKKINYCDFFVGLWGLYYLQGLLYPQGAINQMVQLLMIVIGLVAFAKCLFSSSCGLVKATMVLIIMYTIYGGAIILFGDGIFWTEESTYLKNSFNSLLPILFFYIQTRRGDLNEKRIRIYTLVMVAIVIVYYTYYGKLLIDKLDTEETTNNISYMFVSLLPLVFLFHKKVLLQYLLLALLMLYIIMGMKRGAILVGTLAIITFFISGFKDGSDTKKVISIILSVLIVIGTIYVVQYLMETSDYFMLRVNQTINGDSSHRDVLYNSIWETICRDGSVLYFLFGHGANSTIRFAGNFAHQDWLETLCNNGIIGVSILVIFFVMFVKAVIKSKRYSPNYLFFCFLSLFVISFAKTLFSMSIQNLDVSQSMLIGYLAYWTSDEGLYRFQNEYNIIR